MDWLKYAGTVGKPMITAEQLQEWHKLADEANAHTAICDGNGNDNCDCDNYLPVEFATLCCEAMPALIGEVELLYANREKMIQFRMDMCTEYERVIVQLRADLMLAIKYLTDNAWSFCPCCKAYMKLNTNHTQDCLITRYGAK